MTNVAHSAVHSRYLSDVIIAVVVEGGVTETLQTTPLLRSLGAGAPGAQIVLLCPDAAAALAAGLPAVNEVVTLRALDGRPAAAGTAALWHELRRRRLDAVLLCTRSTSARLAAFLAGVPRRVGPSGGPSAALLTDSGAAADGAPRAATWLRLAAALGIATQLHAPAYDPGEPARVSATRLLSQRSGGGPSLWVALAPGSGYRTGAGREVDSDGLSGTWEPQRYALLANALAQRRGAEVVLLGTPQQRALLDETRLDLGVPTVDLTSEQDLALVAAVLARCDALVAADGPLLHLGAAVGTPVVGLFGPSDGRVRGPAGGDHRVIQALPQRDGAPEASDGRGDASERPLMDRIRVDDVFAALDTVI